MPKARLFLVNETDTGEAHHQIIEQSIREPKDSSEVLIKVLYSSVNYKDYLSASIHYGITRSYPHVPGIDAAGIVSSSKTKEFSEGDEVIITGYDLGMNTNGGWSDYVLVPKEWIVKKPKSLSLKKAMLFGTAGFTAMLAVNKITNALGNKSGNVLVTGASGGVGSLASLILKEQGFDVTCVTRQMNDFINQLNPDKIILADDFLTESNKPLLSREYIAAIDTLGGDATNTLLKQIDYHGAIALCGNILGNNLTSSVFPFLLRGASIFGISSANTEMLDRTKIWKKIAESNIDTNLNFLYQEIGLKYLVQHLKTINSGQNYGRTIIKLS